MGETDLSRLLSGMDPVLDPAVYVFATLPERTVPVGLTPMMVFQEEEGATLILARDDAIAHSIDHHFPCRRITLRIHSALEAVGLIAAVARALTDAGIGANPVSGYFHDHLFVSEESAAAALDAVTALARSSGRAC